MPQNSTRQQPDDVDEFLKRYTQQRIDEEADKHGVPRELARSVAKAESSGRSDVITGRRRSTAGAIGTMQLMPGTAKDLGVDPYDIDQNVAGGVRYLKQQIDAFGGDHTKAVAAYNAGPGNVRKYGGVPPYKETRDYVQKIVGEQPKDDIDEFLERYNEQQPKEVPIKSQQVKQLNRPGGGQADIVDSAKLPPNVRKHVSVIEDLENRLVFAKAKGGNGVKWLEDQLQKVRASVDLEKRQRYAESQVKDLKRRFDYARSQNGPDMVDLSRRYDEAVNTLNWLKTQRGAEAGREEGRNLPVNEQIKNALGAAGVSMVGGLLSLPKYARSLQTPWAAKVSDYLTEKTGVTPRYEKLLKKLTQEEEFLRAKGNPEGKLFSPGGITEIGANIASSFIPGSQANKIIKGTSLAARALRGAATVGGTSALFGGGSDVTPTQYGKNIIGGVVSGGVGGGAGKLAEGRNFIPRLIAESGGNVAGGASQRYLLTGKPGNKEELILDALFGVPGAVYGGKPVAPRQALSVESTVKPLTDVVGQPQGEMRAVPFKPNATGPTNVVKLRAIPEIGRKNVELQPDRQTKSEYESAITEAQKIQNPQQRAEEIAAIKEYFGIEEERIQQEVLTQPKQAVEAVEESALPVQTQAKSEQPIAVTDDTRTQRGEEAQAQSEIIRMRKFDATTEQAANAGNEVQVLLEKGDKLGAIGKMRGQQTLLREVKKALPDSQEGIATKANIDSQIEQINGRIKEIRQGKLAQKQKEPITPPKQSEPIETKPEITTQQPEVTQTQPNMIDAKVLQDEVTKLSTERKQLVAQALNKREQGMTPVKERVNEIDYEVKALKERLHKTGIEQPKSKYAEGRDRILSNPETASLVESVAIGNIRAKNKLYAEGEKAGLTKQNVDDLVGEYINNKLHGVQKTQTQTDTKTEQPVSKDIQLDEQSQSLINSMIRRGGLKREEIPELHRIAQQIAKADGAKSVSFNAVTDAVSLYAESKRSGRSVDEMIPTNAQRTINHSRFGEVTVDESQSGVEVGKLRVIDKEGKTHTIQNPRTSGNRDASYTMKAQSEVAQKVQPAEQKHEPILVKEPIQTKSETFKAGDRVTHILGRAKMNGWIEGVDKQGRPLFREKTGNVYPIKEGKLVKEPSGGHYLGSGFGSLQALLDKRASRPKSPIERSKLLQKRYGPQKTPLLETVLALRKAGLLSSIKTHARNIGGTGAFQAAEEISHIPSSITDLALSAFTGRRTTTGPSITGVGKSAYVAATKGVKEAVEILRKGDINDLKKYQLDKELNSGSKIIDTYVNGTFRLLSAEDKVFRSYAYRRAIEDRAKALALTEVRQGKIKRNQVNERVNEIVTKPDEAMRTEAIYDSEVAVFANDNALSTLISKGKEAAKGKEGGRALTAVFDMVVPFDKTPTNIVKRILDYSPVGLASGTGRLAHNIVKRSMTTEQQRYISQLIGRGSVGTALIMLGYYIGTTGNATGFVEEDKGKRERDKAAGRMPGAILAGNTWRQITGFSPMGNLITLGATIARDYGRAKERPKSTLDKTILLAKTSAKAGGKVISDVPLLEGTVEANKLLRGEGKVSERLGRYAGSFIPTGVSDIGELTDKRRDATGQGFAAQFKARVPGLRQSLPEARDALGRPLEDHKSSFFDPTNPRTAKEKIEDLDRELVSLDIGLSKPLKKQKEAESDYRKRALQYGDLFYTHGTALVKNSFYKSLDKETRKEALKLLSREIFSELNKEEMDIDHFDPIEIVERAEAIIEERHEIGMNR